MQNRVSLTGLLARTSLLYKKKLNAAMEAHEINLSSEMCGVLVELWKQNGRSQQDLADSLHKDKGGMTKIIKSLEGRKLIKRGVDNNDKRKKTIVLTEKGEKLEGKLIPLLEGLRASTLKSIDANEQSIFKQTLHQMINNLSTL